MKVRVLVQRAFFARDSRFCLCSELAAEVMQSLFSKQRAGAAREHFFREALAGIFGGGRRKIRRY